MKRTSLLLLALSICMGGNSFAQISTTAQVLGSGQISPGGSFSLQIQLDNSSTTSLLGITYFIQLNTSAGSGKFSLTGRTITGSPFSDLTTVDGTALFTPSNVLDLVNNSDLGGLQPSLTPVAPAQDIPIANITITSLASLAPGNYTFQLVGNNSGSIPAQVTDSTFNSLGAGSPTFSVNVIPEPSTAYLVLGLGGLLLAMRGRRCVVPRDSRLGDVRS